MDLWITTHWPNLEPVLSPTRHVYFKPEKRQRVPEVGDIVLVYESETVHVDGKTVTEAYRVHKGQRELVQLPRGKGAIICLLKVAGEPRPVEPDDVVYDYGNLSEWRVIPCSKRIEVCELPRRGLMKALGKDEKTPPRFLSLWKVSDGSAAERVMRAVAPQSFLSD